MPTTQAAASDDAYVSDQDPADGGTATKTRRKSPARKRAAKSSEPDAADDGFGGGLVEEAPKKSARRKAAAKRTRSTRGRSDEDGTAEDDVPKKTTRGRSTAAKTAAKKRAPARSRAKKKTDELDLSEFDFGGDDAPPVPINPAAAASVRPKARSVLSDDYGVKLPPSVAKALAAEKLAESRDSSGGGGGRNEKKKSRRGRRGKKDNNDRPAAESSPHPRSVGKSAPQRGGGEPVDGVLEMHPKGYGFLRDASNNFVARESDPFVSGALVDRFRLREGVKIVGEVGPGNRGQGPRLKLIESVDGLPPEEYDDLPKFDALTPVNPTQQIVLEKDPDTVSTRVMDLLTPLGKGQRALIVAPPRSGKTVLLREMADSIAHNHPEVHLIVLLIDERPEEVTEMQRTVNGEVIASSLDHDIESHIRVSQLVIERAKRMAEEGRDVVVLLDSITRMARAFNKWTNSGRVTQGGIDIKALDVPKKLFGTARKFEEGGSVTVVGTVLVETGSRGDDVIFQEFKGTGNMELVLSRTLADRRIFPAIDIPQSSTRREELLLDKQTHESVNRLRRSLISLPATQAMEDLSRTLQKFDTNREFLDRVMQVM